MTAQRITQAYDIPLFSLERKFEYLVKVWHAARIVGNDLPPFEELALGSLGRLADDVALVRFDPAGQHMILRAGRRFENAVGMACSTLKARNLPRVHSAPVINALTRAIECRRPERLTYHSQVDGLVTTYEIMALPLNTRWRELLALVIIMPRPEQLNLSDLIIRSTSDGLMALAALASGDGSPTDFRILQVNAATARLFNRAESELQFASLGELLDSLNCSASMQHFRHAVTMGSNKTFDLEFDSPDGSMCLQVSAIALGEILAVTLTDIRDLKARESSFRLLFDENSAPMYVRSCRSGAFLHVNRAACALYGYEREELIRQGYGALGESGRHPSPGATDVPHGQAVDIVTHRTKSNAERVILEYTRQIQMGGEPAVLSTVVDITARVRAERAVEFLANHDPLTKLANRRLFQQSLEQAFALLAGNQTPFALLSVDLDGFKDVNDNLGHAAGDALLRDVAHRLSRTCEEATLIARLGGDEFAVLLSSAGIQERAALMAGEIINALSLPVRLEGHSIYIGATIGIALAPRDGRDSETLLRHVDHALYRGKRSRRGSFQFFSAEMAGELRRRHNLSLDLRRAVEDGQLQLYFQPILSVANGSLQGFEALLRWNHPTLGLVSPAEFIPIAEENGLIVQIGAWVIAEAARQAATWPDALTVSVNVSAVQFKDESLVEIVKHALSQSGLPARRLSIEVTESVLLSDSEQNCRILRELRALGAIISLDDFGTGYASLNYLQHFMFDRIKIDRSFVRQMMTRPDSLAIVRAIIGLSASLGIGAVAEGVETRAQLEMLQAEKCAEAQGFLFSRPVPEPEAQQIIATYFPWAQRVA